MTTIIVATAIFIGMMGLVGIVLYWERKDNKEKMNG